MASDGTRRPLIAAEARVDVVEQQTGLRGARVRAHGDGAAAAAESRGRSPSSVATAPKKLIDVTRAPSSFVTPLLPTTPSSVPPLCSATASTIAVRPSAEARSAITSASRMSTPTTRSPCASSRARSAPPMPPAEPVIVMVATR